MRLALNWGSQLGIPWSGDSMVFTYGPLYYLTEDMLPDFHTFAFQVSLNVLINLAHPCSPALPFSTTTAYFKTKKS